MTPTAVITGASTGIGRATALLLDQAGYQVFATVRRAADGVALRAEASARLRILMLDVTDPSAIDAAAGGVVAAVGAGGLSALVNNAGVVEAAPLEVLPAEGLERMLAVNVVGVLNVTQAFLPLLRRAKGRVVNIGSVGGISVLPFAGGYCASKFALEALTDAFRMELRPWGIEVVVIEPGSVATPMWEKGTAMTAVLAAERTQALYGARLRAMQARVEGVATEGLPPEAVARVVLRALTARRPKTRYRVGRMAHLRALLQRLPDRLRDRLLLRILAP